jgi:hypothetical protein
MGNPSLQLTSGTFDRMAAQQQLFNTALVDMAAAGGGKYYPRVHTNICDTTPNGDPDVEVPLVGPANTLDENYSSGTFLSTIYSGYLQAWRGMLQDLGFTDLDDFLSTIDLNLHEDVDPVYNAVFGTSLDAVNVFRKTPLEMGTIVLTGSGTGTFTDGDALGTGSGTFDANTNSAAAQLQVYMGSGATTGADLDINMTCLDEDGNTVQNVLVTLPLGSDVGDTVDVETSSDKYLDVVSLQFAGGEASRTVGIRQIIERQPSL